MNSRAKAIIIILFPFLLLSLLPGGAHSFSGLGSGTESDPYIVNTPAQLGEIRDELSKHYRLGDDIDLTGVDWEPIGGSPWGGPSFTGSFDGNHKTIRGLKIEKSGPEVNEDEYYLGLFGRVHNGTVKNLTISDATIKGISDQVALKRMNRHIILS